ncbi:iron complex transport system substrate-binding protein [Oikeobacillus pervagus]|uniref:Iron complex transport system substrate-binding protein n=1 Tax=Oikeobacillus pervagus TaxID=1325931 RepID=A0AAJ1WKE1_9BACI|nr:ABC transporter substrate-binding protein [Oikeobacillus pervagus]MDQ0216423.1 iron complex transport system substrate-binding protein [Oikeobacillus pervagus]
MKKLLSLLFSVFLVTGLLAACGTDQAKPEPKENKQVDEQATSTFPVKVKDATGKVLEIEKQPKRIIPLIPSNTEIAFSLGLDKEIVGVTDNDTYPEQVKDIEKVGGLEINLEKIVALKPDLVLAHNSNAHNSKEGFKQMEEAGIQVLVVNDAKNFDEVYESIEMIGKATGKVKEADTLIDDMKADLEKIKEKATEIKDDEKKRVMIEISPAPEIYAAGKNTFMQEMLDIIHAENVVEQEGWPQLNQEAIIEMDPDVIVATHGFYTKNPIEKILSRKGWEDMKAIKNKQVFEVHADLVNRTGPRLIEGVEELAKAIYPDVFAE